jgi:hypothetical protein
VDDISPHEERANVACLSSLSAPRAGASGAPSPHPMARTSMCPALRRSSGSPALPWDGSDRSPGSDPANAVSGLSSLSANQTTSFFLVSGGGSFPRYGYRDRNLNTIARAAQRSDYGPSGRSCRHAYLRSRSATPLAWYQDHGVGSAWVF